MSNAFIAPHSQTHEAARDFLERTRWPGGPVCSHCGAVNHAYKTKKLGWYRCAEKECRRDFTVTTGTIMERSHIALNKWLMAFYLMASSKKGVSASQLHRALGLDYKSAWFMAHRIREAMRDGGLDPLGGGGGIVEADETDDGMHPGTAHVPSAQGPALQDRLARPPRQAADRCLGRARRAKYALFHVAVADKKTVTKIVTENIARETRLHDEKPPVRRCGCAFPRPRNGETQRWRVRPRQTCTPIRRKATSRSSSAA